ncbi:casein kinase ii regulatory subunit protein [Cardiosporidium cionae]|uniref:Casein kinase II subunit beta n=1 Tax=Cardiosporidium cionae TaxID=476202 RepID=A0ABQ7J7V7_9APIC|nr:casein kinase ii regulatory subunit protein [Cardiosporidium cionae]|eukprot:KAF8820086.1 casein kinase ii regulatory subunit protein [Cardiosporidium cionae]
MVEFSPYPGGATSESFGEELDESDETLDSDCFEESTYTTWIEWFCSLGGHEYFVQVDEDYIRDEFNLKGLNEAIPCFKHALYRIINWEQGSENVEADIIEKYAASLYGLIHSRFILTPRGMQLMSLKYNLEEFGNCPNVACNDAAVLPIGLHDKLYQDYTKVFCPRCNEVYNPSNAHNQLAKLDGSCFGSTFAHLFFLQNPQGFSKNHLKLYYLPKIFGFKVNSNIKDTLRNAQAEKEKQKQ